IRSSFGRSWSATSRVPRICRFDFVVLLVRMWRLKAAARTILPLPVFLKRLAAPRWVFSFGIVDCSVCVPALLFVGACRGRLGRLRFRHVLAPGAGAQDDVHLVAFLARRRFRNRQVSEIRNQPLENTSADL